MHAINNKIETPNKQELSIITKTPRSYLQQTQQHGSIKCADSTIKT
jgi:hypothetical protein